MAKSHEWEIVRYTDKHEVVAKLWFDGRYVQSDNKSLLQDLKDGTFGNDFEHSGEWLDGHLSRIFKSGYMTARKAKKA